MRNFINIEHHFAPHSLTRNAMHDYARRVYNYSLLMLADLGPRQPAVRGWPCYLWPPPQLMVGYPYLIRVCNDYTFDQRTFSRLGFRDRRTRQSRTLDWNCLASCSYAINIGAYLRFLDIDNFEETLADIQQSLLSDRIVADLQLADPLRGVGLWRLPGDEPAEDLAGAGGGAPTPSLQAMLHRRYRHLQNCGPEVWGLCQRTAAAVADPQDLELEPTAPPQDILGTIRRLRSAYFRFILRHQQRRQRRRRPTTTTDDYGDPPTAQQAFLNFLPHRHDPPSRPNAPEDSPWTSQDWLQRFVEAFAVPLSDDPMLFSNSSSRRGASATTSADSAGSKQNTLMTIEAVIDALSLPHRLPRDQQQRGEELGGGAVQLRPRVNGRAVTAAMRRQRGEVVANFIESLPLRTRRRYRPPPASQVISEEDEGESLPPPSQEEEEEEDMEEMEEEDEEEDDIFADMPPLEGDEDEDWWWIADPAERARRRRLLRQQESRWLREVRAAVAEAVRLLQNELIAQMANYDQAFFDFPRDFYAAMRRLQEVDDVNETTLRRWVVYFFVCEHVAATLNYLHGRLVRQIYAHRHLHIIGAQLVMRAYGADGRLAFTRNWHESQQGQSFAGLMLRVARDLSAIVERAGLARLDDADLRDMLEDIAWRENSGEIQDVLDQVTLNDADIDRIDLSFRIRIQGPVAISSNNSIQSIQRRVIQVTRQRGRDRQQLPVANEAVNLPPDPRPPAPHPGRPARR